MFDDRAVHVEAISAELTITRPREIDLYTRAFHELSKLAVYGEGARDLIETALREQRME
jgi:hypothetical protein